MLNLKLNNDSHLLKELSKDFIAGLKKKGIGEDDIFDIHVGLEEALRNAMIHGNKSNPNKKVSIATEVTEDMVTICVEDEGDGFNPENLPDPTLDENLLKESGRGVYLMKHLMDEVVYEKGGRKVVMIKHLNRQDV
ncbi:MAG: ATP-binding protein [Candidatus Omnitrophota bacterium]